MNLCIYCGALAYNERDHLKANRKPLTRGLRTRVDHSHIKTVPCCRACNAALQGCFYETVRDRARFLAEKCAEDQRINAERLGWMRAVAQMEND